MYSKNFISIISSFPKIGRELLVLQIFASLALKGDSSLCEEMSRSDRGDHRRQRVARNEAEGFTPAFERPKLPIKIGKS